MAHRLLHDPDKDGWERSDFPIVCETCLGPNPYVRMQRMEYGAECHISKRPYTKFRWRPGSDARYKSTIICQEVAKAKNVCQVCLLDLKHNLPVQVRDQMTNATVEDIPESEVGLEYQLALKQSRGELGAQFQDKELAENENLARLTRTTPYYKRNRAQLCSFFARGECKRGAECPYRHEMPQTGELAEQNIRDRYYGINDPVARKMMRRLGERSKLEPPADASVTTLFVGNVEANWKEGDLRPIFEAHGDVASVRVVHNKNCAFVTYATRKDAEAAAEKLHDALIINGTRCKLLRGKPQGQRPGQAPPGAAPPGAQASMGGAGAPDYFGVGAVSAYPSMDPNMMGSAGAPQGAPGAGPPARPPMGMGLPPGMPMGPPWGAAPPYGFAGPPPGMMHPGMAPPGYVLVQPGPGMMGPPPAGAPRPTPPAGAPPAAAGPSQPAAPAAAPPQEAAAQ